jgi:hypothetical protein
MFAHSLRQTIPTLLAVVAFSMMIVMNVGNRSSQAGNAPSAEPTPYSADHARIAADPGSHEQPATF